MNNNQFKTWKLNKNLDLPDEKHRNQRQQHHNDHPESHHNDHHQIIERKRIPSILKSADLIVKKANYEHFFTTAIKSKKSTATEPDDSVSLSMNTLTMQPKQPYLPSQQLQQQPTLVALKKHRRRNHRRLKRKLQTIKTNYNHERSSLRSSILKLQLNHDPNTINNHTNQSKRIGIPTSLFDAIEKFLNNLQ